MQHMQMSFQSSNSPTMMALTFLHDKAMVLITMIMIYVFYTMWSASVNPHRALSSYEHHQLETLWTMFPALILMTLAMPSIQLLYSFDELSIPIITMKTTGHQWYWSYDYADFIDMEFDSFMTTTNNLKKGEFRLLEVDNRMILPWGIETRVLVTAADVLHSWTIPSMGVKADAIPGRLNQTNLTPLIPGVFYGQCSEICGANHSFMPISIEIINSMDWSRWVTKLQSE